MNPATERIIKAAVKADAKVSDQQLLEALQVLRGKAAQTAVIAALLLSQAQVARLLNCSRFTVYRLEKLGAVKPVFLTPGLKRYRYDDIAALAAGGNLHV